jgi:hypothetical protein
MKSSRRGSEGPEVGQGLNTLLPYGVLAQGGESDARHQLNAGVRLAADDRPQPRLRGVEGYHHADLTLVHAVGRGQSATVDQSVPIVAEMDECVV